YVSVVESDVRREDHDRTPCEARSETGLLLRERFPDHASQAVQKISGPDQHQPPRDDEVAAARREGRHRVSADRYHQSDDEESRARQHVFRVVPAPVLLILLLLRGDGGLDGLRVEGARAEAATLGIARVVFLTAGALEDLNVGHGRCSLLTKLAPTD